MYDNDSRWDHDMGGNVGNGSDDTRQDNKTYSTPRDQPGGIGRMTVAWRVAVIEWGRDVERGCRGRRLAFDDVGASAHRDGTVKGGMIQVCECTASRSCAATGRNPNLNGIFGLHCHCHNDLTGRARCSLY